jgi:hypothetical protein
VAAELPSITYSTIPDYRLSHMSTDPLSIPYDTIPDYRFSHISKDPLSIPCDTIPNYELENVSTDPLSSSYFESSGRYNSYMDISQTPYGSISHQNTLPSMSTNRLPVAYGMESSYMDPVMVTNLSLVPCSTYNATAGLHDDGFGGDEQCQINQHTPITPSNGGTGFDHSQ